MPIQRARCLLTIFVLRIRICSNRIEIRHCGGLPGIAQRTTAYVARALPGLDPEPVDVRHCWVTELPWHPDGFAVWELGGLLILGGNHLFKHAPALGRALARAALGEGLPHSLLPEARLGAALFESAGR